MWGIVGIHHRLESCVHFIHFLHFISSNLRNWRLVEICIVLMLIGCYIFGHQSFLKQLTNNSYLGTKNAEVTFIIIKRAFRELRHEVSHAICPITPKSFYRVLLIKPMRVEQKMRIPWAKVRHRHS